MGVGGIAKKKIIINCVCFSPLSFPAMFPKKSHADKQEHCGIGVANAHLIS